MKRLLMLALAVLVATALLAPVGAAMASSGVLCSETAEPCAAPWANGTSLDLSQKAGTNTVLSDTTGIVQNQCTGSTPKGSLTNGSSSTSATLKVEKGNLTWSGCTRTTATITGGTLEIHNIAGTANGTVTASGFQVTSKVPGFFGEVSCVFETGTGLDLGTLTEGKPAELDVNTVLKPIAGQPAECPMTSRWKPPTC